MSTTPAPTPTANTLASLTPGNQKSRHPDGGAGRSHQRQFAQYINEESKKDPKILAQIVRARLHEAEK